jgi:hypothetical protein
MSNKLLNLEFETIKKFSFFYNQKYESIKKAIEKLKSNNNLEEKEYMKILKDLDDLYEKK